MQEEVENKTVHLAIQTGKVTVKTLLRGLHAWYRHHQRKKDVAKMSGESVKGKQSVKELIGQGQGVTNIDIAKTDLKGFEKVARKYGIDYAIRKDSSVDPPKYLVFFKAKDADAMTAAFNEYSQKALRKEERPSVLDQLRKFKELVAALPGKVINREKKRELDR